MSTPTQAHEQQLDPIDPAVAVALPCSAILEHSDFWCPDATMSYWSLPTYLQNVGAQVWNIYTAYAGAPEQFQKFSQEILSVHVVVRKVEDQLGISGSDEVAIANRLPGSASIVNSSTRKSENLV